MMAGRVRAQHLCHLLELDRRDLRVHRLRRHPETFGLHARGQAHDRQAGLGVDREVRHADRRVERTHHGERMCCNRLACRRHSPGSGGLVVQLEEGEPHAVDTTGRVDLVDRELRAVGHVDPGRGLLAAHRAFDGDQPGHRRRFRKRSRPGGGGVNRVRPRRSSRNQKSHRHRDRARTQPNRASCHAIPPVSRQLQAPNGPYEVRPQKSCQSRARGSSIGQT